MLRNFLDGPLTLVVIHIVKEQIELAFRFYLPSEYVESRIL